VRRKPKTNIWAKLVDPITQLFDALEDQDPGEERCPMCKGKGVVSRD